MGKIANHHFGFSAAGALAQPYRLFMPITTNPTNCQESAKSPSSKVLEQASRAHDVYDEDYFMRGKMVGKSLYSDYRWLPELTIPMSAVIATHCGFLRTDKILDFGCSRGYLVKALNLCGYNAWGMDVSEWAIANCDPEVSGRVRTDWPLLEPDWIVSKDVLEHIPLGELVKTIEKFARVTKKGIFVVVPLSENERYYVVPDYEEDVTHVQRMSLAQWVSMFHNVMPGASWEISSRYRIVGIKDNYCGWERGNGFITCRRISAGP